MWNSVELCYGKNMTGKKSSTGRCFFIIIAAILCIISPCSPIISDKRLCYDPDCSVIVGTAKTVTNYNSNDPHILSFRVNEDVKIFSRGAGSRKDLLGVQISDKRGYVPSMFVVEKKTYHQKLEHEVPTPEYTHRTSESLSNIRGNEENVVGDAIKTEAELSGEPPIANSLLSIAEQVSPSFEVIDGTTFNLSPKDELNSDNSYATKSIHRTQSVTDQPILTVHPNLMSHETSTDDVSAETIEFPPEVSDPGSLQSMISSSTSGNLTTDTSDLASPDSSSNEQVASSEDDEQASLPLQPYTNEPPTIESDVETPPTHIVEDQKNFQSEKLEPNDTGIIDSTVIKPTINSLDVTIDGNISPVLSNEEQIVGDHLAVPQPNESSIIPEQIITETTTISDTTSNADSSSFDGSSATTEIPVVVRDTDESVNAPTTESAKLIHDEITDTIDDNEEILSNDTLNDYTMQNAIANNIASEEIKNSVDNLSSDISSYADKERLTQNQELENNEIDESVSSNPNITVDHILDFNEFPDNRNSLNVNEELLDDIAAVNDAAKISSEQKYVTAFDDEEIIPVDTTTILPAVPEQFPEDSNGHSVISESGDTLTGDVKQETVLSDACHLDHTCSTYDISEELEDNIENVDVASLENGQHYWETFSYLALTAFTTLVFSLGYYYIENTRRDGQLIAKINKLEKELLISNKECTVLNDTLKSTKTKLNSIEDQSFGSNEMVAALKTELETSYNAKLELEDQIIALEKDLESATEAGLELERMLREILASNNAENPLAKSVEDLQARLNIQQTANESLTNTLHLKTQENEALSSELTTNLHKCERLEMEMTRVNEELKLMNENKTNMEQSLSQKIEQLQNQIKNISAEKITFRKQLKGKEMEIKDLLDLVKQANLSNIDFEKLSDVSRIKADASQLLEEKEELQAKLNELEGAYHLLEEHMKIINEEMKSLSKQCKFAEKEKQDAETSLQVLSKFFKEKEEERQKEEAAWMQQQGEVSMTAERLQTVNHEIQSYKQQIETLKREILDQEREYKNQITSLESKSHEQWVLARQSERRLEEAKVEAGQLRNRLTLIEKNLSDNESDVKTHRLDTNGETTTSPQLFIGAEASSSPIMFTGASNMPPPYLYGPPLPPFLPPHLHASSSMQSGYDVGQRPPPLGGRLSSPPPMSVTSAAPPPPPSGLHRSSGGRYDRSSSSPPSPPISPAMLPPYGHFRSHPPPPLPFPNERIHPPPPIPLPSMLPTHLSSASWGEDKMSSRNNGSFHPFHRDQQVRDYKGSLMSSEESLEKSHHSGKV